MVKYSNDHNTFDELDLKTRYWLSIVKEEENSASIKENDFNRKTFNDHIKPNLEKRAIGNEEENNLNGQYNGTLSENNEFFFLKHNRDHYFLCDSTGELSKEITDKKQSNEKTVTSMSNLNELIKRKGQAFTISGPPKLSELIKERENHLVENEERDSKESLKEKDLSILEFPNLVWCEDEWDKVKEINALERIKEQRKKEVKPFFINKYEKEAARYWDKFYKRNTTNFYQDRHYLLEVFPELDTNPDSNISSRLEEDKTFQENKENSQIIMIELGCGVGNAVFPLLESSPDLFIYALDFSKMAIESFLKKDDRYLHTYRDRVAAFVHDATNPEWPSIIKHTKAHYILCQFSLSAIDPLHYTGIAKALYDILKPGGRVLIRDYGRYDEAQLRFKPGCLLKDNFYVRQDGTRAYYFTTEDLKDIFCPEGFTEIENLYIRRQYANRKDSTVRYRSWVHAKFEKPFL